MIALGAEMKAWLNEHDTTMTCDGTLRNYSLAGRVDAPLRVSWAFQKLLPGSGRTLLL